MLHALCFPGYGWAEHWLLGSLPARLICSLALVQISSARLLYVRQQCRHIDPSCIHVVHTSSLLYASMCFFLTVVCHFIKKIVVCHCVLSVLFPALHVMSRGVPPPDAYWFNCG